MVSGHIAAMRKRLKGALKDQGRDIGVRLTVLACISALPLVVYALVLLWSLGRLAAGGAALLLSLGVSLVATRSYARRIAREVHENVQSRHVEHELRERAEARRVAAEAADRNKDFFLAMVSHELRGTLTAVIGWLEIGAHAAEQASVLRALNIALRNARQQARIMDDLLDVSRILSGQFALEHRPVNLSRVAQEALDGARPSAEERRVELSARVQEPLFVRGDRGRLLQAIGNLLSNGIKFNKAGGRVELALERSGAQARLVVADNGAGIDAAALPHVFERYWQGEPSEKLRRRGLGLGLTLVRQIVETHGGNVRAESSGREKGARFTIELPLMSGAETTAEEGTPSEQCGEAQLNGLAVVAVDRNEDTLDWLQYLLATHGAMTCKARSAEEALAVAQREVADVLIADVADVDEGYTLVRALRAKSANPRVAAVALSSLPSEAEWRRALAAGYNSFIAKPCDPQVVVRAVRVAAFGHSVRAHPCVSS